MKLLAQLLCSQVRAALFRVLFGLSSSEIHLRELHRQTGFAIGTVRQDIEKLVGMGLVLRQADGNRVYYSANRSHPFFAEIHRLVLKSDGLVDAIAETLPPDQFDCVLVFGSLAAGTERPDSDIDLLMIGNVGLRKVTQMLSGLGDRLGREINPVVLSRAEFRKRTQEADHFLMSVLDQPKLFVRGDEDVLKSMAH